MKGCRFGESHDGSDQEVIRRGVDVHSICTRFEVCRKLVESLWHLLSFVDLMGFMKFPWTRRREPISGMNTVL